MTAFNVMKLIYANFAISALQNGFFLLLLRQNKCTWRRFTKPTNI
jgi:hypothetical protein